MTLEELISKLQEIYDEQGDIEVMVDSLQYHCPFNDIEYISVRRTSYGENIVMINIQ